MVLYGINKRPGKLEYQNIFDLIESQLASKAAWRSKILKATARPSKDRFIAFVTNKVP